MALKKDFVKFDKVDKSYDGKVLVVKDLQLDIEEGEFVTMLGPSGSGKTTCLMMLAGFETPTNGEIYLDGNAISSIPPHKRGIGMVFQNYALFPHMTVYENLAPMSFTFEIQGSKANLLLSNAHMPRIQREGKEAWESEYINLDFDFINGRNLANREQFVDLHSAIRTGKETEVSGIHGLRALAIMRAILLSDLEKRSVSIEEILSKE